VVEIQCPNCKEHMELEDGLNGLFDCPYCSERFLWNSEHQTHSVNPGFFDLWLGLLIPALCIYPGLTIMIEIFDPQGLDALFYILFAILFCLSTAVILGLIGLKKKRGDLALGAGLSPIVSGIIFWISILN
jgi:DNA-directed RNA polymerase subunit RPC12/RpoP